MLDGTHHYRPEAGGELLLEGPAALPNLVSHPVFILFFKPEESEPNVCWSEEEVVLGENSANLRPSGEATLRCSPAQPAS